MVLAEFELKKFEFGHFQASFSALAQLIRAQAATKFIVNDSFQNH